LARALEDYLEARYQMRFEMNEGGYGVWHPDFGKFTLYAWDENLDKAIKELDGMREFFIKMQFQQGNELPFPEEPKPYSGNFVLRIPKDLHARLAQEAKENNVSLNAYIQHLLSERHRETSAEQTLKEIQSQINAHIATLREKEKQATASAEQTSKEIQSQINALIATLREKEKQVAAEDTA